MNLVIHIKCSVANIGQWNKVQNFAGQSQTNTMIFIPLV